MNSLGINIYAIEIIDISNKLYVEGYNNYSSILHLASESRISERWSRNSVDVIHPHLFRFNKKETIEIVRNINIEYYDEIRIDDEKCSISLSNIKIYKAKTTYEEINYEEMKK